MGGIAVHAWQTPLLGFTHTAGEKAYRQLCAAKVCSYFIETEKLRWESKSFFKKTVLVMVGRNYNKLHTDNKTQ